jgi:HPt (histidine-containing phosphotransfer) domain-containing protein
MLKLKQIFFKQHKNTCDEIFDSVESGKLNVARLLVHTLKSNAGFIGEAKLQMILATIEKCLLSHPPSQDLLDKLKTEFDLVIQKISEFLKNAELQEASIDISEVDIPQMFAELEILLKRQNVKAIDYIDSLKAIPETETLVEHLENFDLREALVVLSEIRCRGLNGR